VRRAPDLGIYFRAIPMLARHPSVLVAPLLGAVVAIVLGQIAGYVTPQIGYLGASLLTWAAQVFYFYAFAVAIIQADAIERGLRTNFDSAWEDARRKAGGIIVAAIGFWFLFYVAQDIGLLFNSAMLVYILELVVVFFFVYSIPAAAIGGLPGGYALGASMRATRGDVAGAALLAIGLVALFEFLPVYLVSYIPGLSNVEATLVVAAMQAIVLGYLAFPFAKQYADVAYRV
jgi:hypothetical protein